jgi:outer membrane protein assembly factor BamB
MIPLGKIVVQIALLAGLLIHGALIAAPGDLVGGWPFQADGIVFGGPAIGPNGEIVFGTEVKIDDATGDGSVYSLNPDGSQHWKFELGSDYFDSAATIADDGTVYIGCWDGKLYAINGDDGSLLWSYMDPEIQSDNALIVASPAVGPDGTIYFASYAGYLYALYPDGQQKWRYEPAIGFSNEVSDLSPINGSPVLNHSGDTVYFGNDNGTMYAVDTATGTRNWFYLVPDFLANNGVTSAAAIGLDGSIYFCSENGFIYALNSTGSFTWKFASTDSMRSSPVIDKEGNVYCTSRDGYLYAIDPLGDELWEAFVGDVFYCSPAIDAGGNIIVGAYAGIIDSTPISSIVSVDPTGTVQWSFDFEGYHDSSPNIAPDGSIYFGAHNGNLYRIEGNGAALANSGWPRQQGNRRQTGWWEDLSDMDLVDYFPAISKNDKDWHFIPWFGSGWVWDIEVPWILHEEHGFLYIEPAGPDSIWFWDSKLKEWCYSSNSQQDFLFQAEVGSWLYYSTELSDELDRWFYDFGVPSWLQIPRF